MSYQVHVRERSSWFIAFNFRFTHAQCSDLNHGAGSKYLPIANSHGTGLGGKLVSLQTSTALTSYRITSVRHIVMG